MGKGECSICNAPADVRTAIDEALLKKEKLRDLAARTAFSRASLSRHSIKHPQRNLLASHKWHSRYDPQRNRLWMVGPGDSPMTLIRDVQPARFWSHSARLKPEDVQDVILRVEFESAFACKQRKTGTRNSRRRNSQHYQFGILNKYYHNIFVVIINPPVQTSRYERNFVGFDSSTGI